MGREIRVQVDSVEQSALPDETVLELLGRLQIEMPHVCRHPSLGALRTCDTCIVEVDGELVQSCATTVREGMKIGVDKTRALEARKEGMQRLLGNHELYCTICDYNNGDCEVHNAADLLGLRHQKYPFTQKGYEVDATNPFYQYDPNQCVLCARCVEACQDVQVTETLSIDWTLENPRVLWDGGRKINDSSCVSCGHCITVCPCNALMEKGMLGHAGHFTSAPASAREKSIDLVKFSEKFTGLGPLFATSKMEAAMRQNSIKRTKTVCTYCGVGCSFEIWTKGHHILKVQPHKDAPANGISTCVKGKFGWDYVNSDDRITQPLIRKNDVFEPVSWEEAYAEVARRLREIEKGHGKDSLAFISSSKTSNEECYLVQKIARAIFKTNNVDNCARYCQSPASKGLSRTVGYGADSGTMNDIEKADLVILIGSNTADSHPVLAARIKRGVKLRGQRLIVSDLREHEMARRAHHFLRPRSGTDLVWVNAVARYILEQGWEDQEFIEQRVNNFEDYRKSLDPFSLEWASEVTGISAEVMKTVAREVVEAERVCLLWAMGVTQHSRGTDSCTAFSNLLLLTGNYGKPGTGGYPLRGHNNVQGSCDFGALYNYLPGYKKVSKDKWRAHFEAAWDMEPGSMPSAPGLNNRTIVEAAHDGKLKGLWVVGEELGLVDSNTNHVQEALSKLDLLIVQDIFLSTTCRYADIVLPGTPTLEKEGTFVNTERRIQRLYEVLPPLGNSRPDWRIFRDIAAHLGHDWKYRHPSDIMDEVASIVPEFAGVRYDRLEGWNSLVWPVDKDGRDTPLLYKDRFRMSDGKAKFFPVEFHEPTNQPDAEFPFHLNNGRVLEHFHEGNMTYRVPHMKEKVREAFVLISQQDAHAHALEDGDWVRLRSPFGQLKTQAVISDEVRPGELYMPVCSSQQRVNYLTSSKADPVVDTPAYKECQVNLTKLGENSETPLPRGNPRYGDPTPQVGVKVEEKWQRPDYRAPVEDRPTGGSV